MVDECEIRALKREQTVGFVPVSTNSIIRKWESVTLAYFN